MSEAGTSDTSVPAPGDMFAGLNFAMLLVTPELEIRFVNPAAESMIGMSAKRIMGRNLLDVVDLRGTSVAERIREADAQLIARGLDLQFGDRRQRTNLTVSALTSHPGWSVVTLSDTGQGERFGGEERRAAMRGPAVLAHEIKNPLAAIRGAAQLLARKVGEGEKALTDLITDEVDRIAALIDRMQRLGRSRAEPIGPLNLHEAIHRAYETVKLSSGPQIGWREEFDPSLPPVLGNEGALVQVLVNLMANARDACGDETEPQVKVQTRFASGLVMNVFRLGRPVKLPIEVLVSDNGPGVDPALRDDIFEPFVSSKPQGQGLGLALVQKLVRDMDGRISHERDAEGGWTHFRVNLPMAR